MDAVLVGVLGIVLLFILLAMGVQVGVVMGVVGFIGVWLITGNLEAGMGLINVSAFYKVVTYDLSCLPLFILMGYIALESGITHDVFDSVTKWFGRLPGGLAIATVIGNALFGAICGASIVATTVFTKISLPEMIRYGYDQKFACGSIVGGAMLGMLIPPSILMVLYGIITEQSVAHLLMAGVGPGIMLALMFCILCFFMAYFKPKLAPRINTEFSLKEKLVSLKGVGGVAIIAFIIVGGIYTGVFSPTEAGAVGAFSVLGLGLLGGKIGFSGFMKSIKDTANVTATIFLVIIGAMILSRFLAMSTIPAAVSNFIIGLDVSELVMVAAFMVLYLAMGCILDSFSMMLITLPIIHPVILDMGLDPIWFAMCVIMAIEVGLLTPPFGLNIYALKAAAGDEVELADVFRGALPFFGGGPCSRGNGNAVAGNQHFHPEYHVPLTTKNLFALAYWE